MLNLKYSTQNIPVESVPILTYRVTLKKIFFILIFAFLICVFENIYPLSAYPEISNTLNNALANYNIQFEKAGSIPVVKNFKYCVREKTFRTIIAQADYMRIEIEAIKPINEETALQYSNSKYVIIKGLFEPQMIPYSGELTHRTECPAEKKPEEITVEILDKKVTILLVNATERYVVGAWDDALIKQKAAFAALYDSNNKTLYQIVIFQPYKTFNLDEILGIFKGIKSAPNNYINLNAYPSIFRYLSRKKQLQSACPAQSLAVARLLNSLA